MTEQTLHGLLDTVWGHLSRGVADRRHPARHPTLATIGPDGPEARTLVLRDATRAGATLELYTDASSRKAAQILADPRVALHVWLPKPQLQIRMRATATLAPGDPAVFAALPPEAQANYGGPPPGTPLPDAREAEGGDTARFIRIICRLTEIDALSLTDPRHRALYCATDDWAGRWIAP
jgi:hypothetical protein